MEKQILEEVPAVIETPTPVVAEITKEDLPVDFVTSFVSKSWDEIGVLKASIEAISKDFSNSEKVAKILQDLVDAYLICVGQLELFLHKNDYLDAPKEAIEEPEVEEPVIAPEVAGQTEEPVVSETPVFAETQPLTENLEDKKEGSNFEPFEYFCDFDDIK